MTTALTVAKDLHGYRSKQTAPKPPVLPACKNCRHYAYDEDDRLSLRGQLTFRITNRRCILLNIRVNANGICNEHAFKYANCRDR